MQNNCLSQKFRWKYLSKIKKREMDEKNNYKKKSEKNLPAEIMLAVSVFLKRMSGRILREPSNYLAIFMLLLWLKSGLILRKIFTFTECVNFRRQNVTCFVKWLSQYWQFKRKVSIEFFVGIFIKKWYFTWARRKNLLLPKDKK